MTVSSRRPIPNEANSEISAVEAAFKKLKQHGFARICALAFMYTLVLMVSIWLAHELRFDFAIPPSHFYELQAHWPWVVGIKILFLFFFGQFSGLLSYFSLPDLKRLIYSIGGSSLLLLLVRVNTGDFFTVPRGVLLLDFILSLGGLACVRIALRVLRESYHSDQNRHHRRARRVGIIGAGDVGATLAKDLLAKRGLGLNPVAFFDDDSEKWKSRVHNIPVFGPPEVLTNNRLNLQLEEIIIALPNASARRRQEIIQILQKTRLKFETVPSMDQLATGQVKVSQLRSVEIQDLLGREPVELETENIRAILKGKVVMVTGGGGSIGGELCRQIAGFNPKRLLIVEQSEVQIFQIEQELNELGYRGVILPLVADVLDKPRMRHIFQRFQPEVVFHAAAHKHVPMMEGQPSEAIKNNSWGTAATADFSLEFGVERFILISTDKAINPTNVMGASKRLAEIYIQALSSKCNGVTKFMAVRFGNVLGSSGSVIPTFKKQIAAGGPVKVTHPDVTRYFMTIPEAVGLVLQSAAQGRGGEIFVLDMGEPVKIVNLARQLIELSGLKPEEDIQIEFVGLRPGEKLFEELSHQGENIAETEHEKIMRFVCEPESLEKVKEQFAELEKNLHSMETNQFKQLLQKVVPEYQPFLD